MELLNKYKNGNCTIEIYSDGTRIIEWPDGEEMKLDFPLNIDIRLMTKCDFGYNPTTGKSVVHSATNQLELTVKSVTMKHFTNN